MLEALLGQPGFGVGPASLGAELEVALVDAQARPLPRNEEVLRETSDERMTVELDRFNLECNLLPTALAGCPFAHLQREIESARAELGRAAARYGGRIATVGILPTLVEADLQSTAMTDAIRYRALSRSLREQREGPFRLRIDGEDPLRMECEDVTFEGAATSSQVHLRVASGDFAAVFDAAQLATADPLVDRVLARAESGRTAARWQRMRLAELEASRPRREALVRMFEEYLDRSAGGEPVHRWGAS